ncbi:transketolase [Alkaliphilus serpentinus]|uniref:Transketolase n=1 Tax=Alkaliphilus serpentinus TaxID=1482731 RepID=A0A833M8D1_9FIRM|nr:transketolase [Alkaliphilus serpentinus]KAB3530696.1 transketolase [Alkaliphilus serpentinus]
MLKAIANIVRGLSADAVEAAISGHPGLPLGCAEIGGVLYGEVLNYNPKDPHWINRDRFVLSAGHGSMLLYSYLHLAQFDLPLEEIKAFRQLGSITPGHPEIHETPGVEATTGPLGQGFSNAVGMALAERILAKKYNTEDYTIIDHYTYTLMGDGCMMEGVTSEAASLAGHLGLGKLIAIYDSNNITIEGNTSLAFTESVADRFRAYGWQVIDNIDGHNVHEVREAILTAKEEGEKPSLIIAKTTIGYGAPNKEGTSSVHGSPLGESEVTLMKEAIGLPNNERFYISEEVKNFFSQRIKELEEKYRDWVTKYQRWSEDYPKKRKDLEEALNLELPKELREDIAGLKIKSPSATRKSSSEVLTAVADNLHYLIGGSADLAPSNNTYLKKYSEIQKGSYDGRNLRFGVREHGMAAIANGISLHGGLRPYCGSFLVFSDYMRAGIRMSAIMKQPVIYVLTHDSIAVGEDGPTHQPIEHLESLRLIPNLKVIRPADAEEVKEGWLLALENLTGPTALILTRQDLPLIEKEFGISNMARGAYIVEKEKGKQEVTLMASGSELALAVETAGLLKEKKIGVRVVSVPDRGEFVKQENNYIHEVLGDDQAMRVAIEAGVGIGWYQLLKDRHMVVGIEDFGASGKGEEVQRKFGFVAEKIANDILKSM